MILSASRRTDLPAFYTAWFLRRLREGFALARGPYTPHRLTRVPLEPGHAGRRGILEQEPRSVVGRSGKGSARPAGRLGRAVLSSVHLNALRPGAGAGGLPPTAERIRVFRRLAKRLGPERMVWRYDPVAVNGRCTAAFHREAFARLAGSWRAVLTNACSVFSTCTPRRKSGRPGWPIRPDSAGNDGGTGPPPSPKRRRGRVWDCGPAVRRPISAGTVSSRGPALIRSGWNACPPGGLPAGRDPGQRPGCGCAQSVDIGGYDTCTHGCVYCYATSSGGAAARNRAAHDPRSPLLTGWPGEGDVIVERKAVSRSEKSGQLHFFD